MVVLDELVHAGRTVARLGAAILGQIDRHRYAVVLQRQVHRLVLFVVGVGDEHRAQLVEGQLAVGLGVVDAGALRCRLQAGMVRLVVAQGPGELALEQPLLDTGHEGADGAALLEPLLEVARLVQLGVQPRRLEGAGVAGQLVVAAIARHGVEGRLGRHLAALDGGVAALDARCIQEPGFAADQRAAREGQLGQRQQSARGDGPRAIGDALAAFEGAADGRVGLVALEFLERRQPRIGVVQAHDQADHHHVVVQVIEERAAVGVGVQRPAGGMHHQARTRLGRVDLPHFLDADAVRLRVAALVQLVAADQLAAQLAARPFGK
ncbi:Uncharacterised protein [Bordetella pertussis]|nr:Uncharacterised protein [Bordetella pertussis]